MVTLIFFINFVITNNTIDNNNNNAVIMVEVFTPVGTLTLSEFVTTIVSPPDDENVVVKSDIPSLELISHTFIVDEELLIE
jgi:hypothetical protein